MAFGSLSVANRVITLLELKGSAAYVASADRSAAAMERLAAANRAAAVASANASKRTFAQNQILFTSRRLLFYGTLALGAFTAAAVKMGFSYSSALQTAKVALQGLIGGNELKSITDQLYTIAALSPFVFQDVTVAFRTMFVAFHGLGISAKTTVDIIQSITDALAVAGKTSPGAMNRVAVALQHMAYQGRLTGYTVNQLARDGLPIFDILNKELGVTGDQLHQIASLGIPTGKVLQAIIHYMRTTPPFAGAAARISNQTLSGAWAQFRDILAKAASGGTGGMFGFLQSTLAGVNTQLQPLFKGNKPLTITNIAEAFDKQLSPNTHLIINLFTTLNYIVKTLITTFGGLLLGIQKFLKFSGLDYLLSLLNSNKVAAKLLGIAIGTLISLWILERIWLFRLALAKELNIALDIVMRNQKRAQIILEALWQAALSVSIFRLRAAMVAATIYAAAQTRLSMALKGSTIATWLMTAATTALDIALGPVGLVAALVLLAATLVILYFKWKAFHDIVNSTYNWLKAHPYAAFFIPIIGPTVTAIILIQKLYNWLKKIYDLAKNPIRVAIHLGGFGGLGGGKGGIAGRLGRAAGNWFIRTALPFTNIPGVPFPHFQEGGTMVRPGLALVGEGGPEVVNLPAGAQVQPLPLGARGGAGYQLPPELNLRAVLRVDGKDIAEVVAKHRLDRQARS